MTTMADDLGALAHRLSQAGEPFALATVVRCERPTSAKPGAKAIIRKDGTAVGWIGGSCAEPVVVREGLRALRDGRPRFIALVGDQGARADGREGVVAYTMTCHSGGTLEIFVEPVMPKPELLLIGTGPVVDTLARLGQAMEFAVARLSTERERLLPSAVSPRTFVVVATHGSFDEDALEQALRSEARYVSLVASRKRAAAVIDALTARGLATDRLNRLKAPAGLDIGAVTPEEIAVSILAEIIQVARTQMRDASPEARASEAGELETKDPVCGMSVEVATAKHRVEASGKWVYFCSAHCKETFVRDPARFIGSAAR